MGFEQEEIATDDPRVEAARADVSMKPDEVATFCRALWRSEREVVARLAPLIDPNGRDRWGNTPLLMAAQYGDLPLVSLLVRRGAEVNQGRRFLTPITLAARRGASAIVECLRDAGALMSIVTWTYLGEDTLIAQELERDPRRAALRDELGTPLIHHAAESLRPSIVTLLLDRGASLAETDPNGETPLHRVADMRQAPATEAGTMATLLLDRGADPNAGNWDDVTPLHQAVRARNLAVVEVLLSRGADPNARDRNRGSTPLRRAVSASGAGGTAGTAELMAPLTRVLLKHGADPDMKDKRGVSIDASAHDPKVRAVLEEHRREKHAIGPPPRPAKGQATRAK
jgi:ankyrin repeat protein